MTNAQITQIVEAARLFMEQHGLTQAELATRSGLSAPYLSTMLQGKTKMNDTAISDHYWVGLAKATGLEIEASYWNLVKNVQFQKIVTAIDLARERCSVRTIIGNTGSGKTYAANIYAAKNPKNTYLMTLHNLYSVTDILNELLVMMGEPTNGSKHMRMYRVIDKLRQIKKKGGNPVVILDEAENVASHTMKMLKGFYDGLVGYCGIVLIGTNQLVTKMTTAKLRDREAAPQFYRRYSTGILMLPEIDGFADFFATMNVTDAGLRKLLRNLCDNYGVLNTYLEPVIREASEQGLPVSEQLFREYWDMPF